MPVSVTGIGAAVSLLTFLLFAVFRTIGIRKRTGTELCMGEILNSAGFGLLPGIGVWKIFEQNTLLSSGTEAFDPFLGLSAILHNGRFAVSRLEMILASLSFAGIVFWLIVRRKDLTGNGDLMLTVICIWGLIRAFTEGFREVTILRTDYLNLTQIMLLAAADIPMAVWTLRLEAQEKSTAFAVLEWIAVLSCETVLVLNTSGVLSAGSRAGDLAVNACCTVLCMLLILSAGKDSRN